MSKLFGSWFGSVNPKIVTHYMGPVSARFNRDAYEHYFVRAIVDCIATNAAKAQALHVVLDENGRVKHIKQNSQYVKLLNQQANELMSGYDFKYKLVTMLQNHTTALAYVKWDNANPVGFFPVNYSQLEILKVPGVDWAARFIDAVGDMYTLPLSDCVVLRKFYNQSDIYGGGNKPIYDALDLMKSVDQGIAEAVAVSNKVRVIHKKKSAQVSPLDKTRNAKQIHDQMVEAASNGGVMEIDVAEDLAPFNFNAFSVNASQMREIRNSLLSYWRISEEIMQSKYTEPQWQAFYESVLEPILVMMGQAFTNVCFTQRERDHGNRIIFSAPMLLHASTQTKITLLQATKEVALFTINEQRELLGYPPVEGGDKREVSLNYVNANNQDKYQTGEEDAGDGDPGQEDAGTEI